jgi:hypothetical protein
MTKALTKVIYKPDNTSTHEYTVIVNPDEVGFPHTRRSDSPDFRIVVVQYNKWKEGGKPTLI